MDADSIESYLDRFPKKAPPLPKEHLETYRAAYRENRSGKGLFALVALTESWMHRRVCRRKDEPGGILEIGAGNLNHLSYEQAREAYDIVEPQEEPMKESSQFPRIRDFFVDLRNVPVEKRYRRIISVATFEHLAELPRVIARCATLLEPDGTLQVAIPTEGGFLWGLTWRWTTAVVFRLRYRLDYGVLMRHEHINTADEVETLIRHFFGDVQRARFPFPFYHGSFYTYVEAKSPRLERCREYLVRRRVSPPPL